MSAPESQTKTAKPEKNRYKSTLNLPRTSFPMKANLLQNENQSTKRWDKMGLYQKLRDAGKAKAEPKAEVAKVEAAPAPKRSSCKEPKK